MTAIGLNSYSLLIRDGLLDRIRLLPKFADVARFGKTSARPVQAEQIPYLAVYFIEEDFEPDGEANVAEPRFLHTVKMGFSYIIQNNDDELAEDKCDQGHWAIMQYLTRQDWHTFPTILDTVFDVNGNEVQRPLEIEAVTGGMRSHHFGNIGQNPNETPVAEMRMEWNLTYRTSFPPFVPDDLERIHIDVVYPYPRTAVGGPAPDRIEVIAVYELEVAP